MRKSGNITLKTTTTKYNILTKVTLVKRNDNDGGQTDFYSCTQRQKDFYTQKHVLFNDDQRRRHRYQNLFIFEFV